MTWVDYSILGVVLLSTLIGLQRGLVREILSLISLGVSLAVGLALSEYVAPLFQDYITTPSMRRMAAFAVLFFAMLLIMALINHVLVTLVEETGIHRTDQLLGMVFGLARGTVLVAGVIFLAGFTPFPQDPWWQEAQLIHKFEGISKLGCRFLPNELHKYSTFCGP